VGQGLNLAGGTISVPNGGITNALIANGVDYGKIGTQTSCAAGYSQAFSGSNLCWTGWRSPTTYGTASSDCIDEGAHICSYEDFHHAWAGGANPSFANGDFIGNIVGDDTVLCVNNTTSVTNFDGTCGRDTSHWYRCCTGRR
jgi:hypothetical protein